MIMLTAARCYATVVLLVFSIAASSFPADPVVRLVIDTGTAGLQVSPMMHDLFFEDINYGADGGLYAELVQNRSFEHAVVKIGGPDFRHAFPPYSFAILRLR